jgi:hypothetical protein
MSTKSTGRRSNHKTVTITISGCLLQLATLANAGATRNCHDGGSYAQVF